jgi:hypothetical protein
MKQNVQQVKYNEQSKNTNWWTWDEFCDKCGKQIRTSNVTLYSKKPDNKSDYCLDCLYEILG